MRLGDLVFCLQLAPGGKFEIRERVVVPARGDARLAPLRPDLTLVVKGGNSQSGPANPSGGRSTLPGL